MQAEITQREEEARAMSEQRHRREKERLEKELHESQRAI